MDPPDAWKCRFECFAAGVRSMVGPAQLIAGLAPVVWTCACHSRLCKVFPKARTRDLILQEAAVAAMG